MMNDYKKLIEILRMAGESSVELADGSFDTYLPTAEKCHDAADAVEQLMKERDELTTKCCRLEQERDAAVADLSIHGRFCVTCRNRSNSNYSPNCTPTKCLTDENEFWEWRGVKEDNDK